MLRDAALDVIDTFYTLGAKDRRATNHVLYEAIKALSVALDREEETDPIVLIGVEGGVADWTKVGHAWIEIIDWDEVRANPEYARDKLDYFRAIPELARLLSRASWEEFERYAQPIDDEGEA